MFSNILAIASLVFTINAGFNDILRQGHPAKTPGKVVNGSYDIFDELDFFSNSVISPNPHINDLRRRCDYKINDRKGYYNRGGY